MKKLLKNGIMIALAIIIAFSAGGCQFLLSLFEGLKSPKKPQNLADLTPHTLSIVIPEGKYASVSQSEYIECYMVVNGGVLSADAYDLTWTVDGELVENASSLYVIGPYSSAKKVSLEATLTFEEEKEDEENITKTLTAQAEFVFYGSAVNAEVERRDNGTATEFLVDEDIAEANIVEWFVNGEFAAEGARYVHDNTRVGSYEIECKVNGNAATIENPNVVTVGAVKPTGISIDFDTYYPNIEVKWNDVSEGGYEIKLSSMQQTVTTTGSSYLFTLEQMPLDESSVTVSVRSLGDGNAFEQSDYVSIYASRLNSIQINYLSTSYGVENAYVTSDEDFFVQFEQMMFSREQPITEYTTLTRQFYMAFNFENDYGNITGLRDAAFDRVSYAGLYAIGASYDLVNSIATVSIEFKTVNVPEVDETHAPTNYSNNANGYPLAISDIGREASSLPIEQREKTVKVYNTDALYRVVEMGYKPTFDAGSRCESIYEAAKEVVCTLTDESMSDYEIALAFYEWVMFHNHYNNDVVKYETAQAVKYPAFYLEGMLSSGYRYAVCDGIAKTYSLLCNMAGVEAVRVTGLAGHSGQMGSHAWNKVKVDGKWYVVDATWGDQALTMYYQVGIMSRSMSMELATHKYFLVSDADIAISHVEDPCNYPRTAPLAYGYYEKQTAAYSGRNYDFSITHTAEIAGTVSALANYIASKVDGTHIVTDGLKSETSNYYTFELKYNTAITSEVYAKFKSNGSLATSIKSMLASYLFYDDGGTIIIIVSSGGNKLSNNSLSLS